MNSLISIIIPCYNMGAFLKETLDSVTSYPNKNEYEIIIVNDGSTDEATINLLSKLEKKGFFVLNQENQGLAKARNNGIQLAKGEYILPLDADNKIRHNYISESIRLLDQNSNIDVVYGNRQHFDEDDSLIVVPDFNFPLLCEKNYIDACACYRKSIWEKVNGYDENMPVMGYEDWDFWLRASLQGAQFYKIDNVTFDYRVRTGSMISDTNKKYNQITQYIFDKKELSIIKSVAQTNKIARQYTHIKNSMEYKIGKLIMSPIRWIQNILN